MVRTRMFACGIPALIAALACGQSAALTPVDCAAPMAAIAPQATTRSFGMGFSRWPPDFSAEAVQGMYAFIASHADLLLHHFDGGVPWPEALQGRPLSDHAQDDWTSARAATPEGHQVFVAITPLDDRRAGLAKYWGDTQNQPLPEPWDRYPLDHPEVKRAFLNYAEHAVRFFSPDYLAIGIEVNLLLIHAPEQWEAYQELHRETYLALKARYPELPVFLTVTLPHLRGEMDAAEAAQQQAAVAALVPFSDLVGLSAYPYNWIYDGSRQVPEDYFDPALQFDRPIAVAETGMPSQAFTAYDVPYNFRVEDQTDYIELLLGTAAERRFEFVVNWAPIDFDPLLEHLPGETRELATYWAYTGLQRSDGCPKPALAIWDAYLALPRE